MCDSPNRDCIHITSDVAWIKALYSALVLDPNTSDCFFDDHETKLGPKKSAKPATNFLSSPS